MEVGAGRRRNAKKIAVNVFKERDYFQKLVVEGMLK
jgi:hypothetical protein